MSTDAGTAKRSRHGDGRSVRGALRVHGAIVGAALVSVFVLAPPATARSHKSHEHHASAGDGPMRNFGVVWEHKLTRSGMPNEDSGWTWLRGQGVRSVVTFRRENDVDYANLGFRNTLHIPLSKRIFPTESQAERFLSFIQDSANQPVHIHCEAGRDRTGMMTALARYAVDGWPLERALAEARTYRGGKDLEDVRVEWLRTWVASHPPGSARLGLVKSTKP
jgi:protein tyrosine/serine phosphatase